MRLQFGLTFLQMLVLKHANHFDLMWHAVVHQAQELIEKRVPSSAVCVCIYHRCRCIQAYV